MTHVAVVLAAGKGTRMKSQTPKVLHRICGREMVGLVVDSVIQSGLDDVVVVVPQGDLDIKAVLGEGVRYVEQSEPLGSGDALLQAKELMKNVDDVVVLCGDVPLIRHETIQKLVDYHHENNACITLMTAAVSDPEGSGRVVRSSSGEIKEIIEEREADEDTKAISEINSGVYCFRAAWLWDNLSDVQPANAGEIYLTDLVSIAARSGMIVGSIKSADVLEGMGVNTRVHLAEASAVMRRRILERWMEVGVTVSDPNSVYIDTSVVLGQDSVLLPNSHITGHSRIGLGCEIGPNSIVNDSLLGNGCKVSSSVIKDSTLEDDVEVGPFSHVRSGSYLEKGVHVGNCAEIKSSRLGFGTKSGHFSYLGDAAIGSNVNIGAGTVTCNYDGHQKNRTVIGDGAFIGSDSMLVAPVKIGARALTGAGSVVTDDVPEGMIVTGMPAKSKGRFNDLKTDLGYRLLRKRSKKNQKMVVDQNDS